VSELNNIPNEKYQQKRGFLEVALGPFVRLSATEKPHKSPTAAAGQFVPATAQADPRAHRDR
jgi:hypothetical protein